MLITTAIINLEYFNLFSLEFIRDNSLTFYPLSLIKLLSLDYLG
jgi:hypothetical protein